MSLARGTGLRRMVNCARSGSQLRHETASRFRPENRRQEADARGPLRRACDADAGLGRSVLLAGQCRERGGRLAADPDLAACDPHQEHPGRQPRLADARRAQGRRSAGRRARHADGPRGGHDRRQRSPPLSRAPAGSADVRRLCRFRGLPDRDFGSASGRGLRPHRRSETAGYSGRYRGRRRTSGGGGRRGRAT